jgi:hypothetical protein
MWGEVLRVDNFECALIILQESLLVHILHNLPCI